MLSTSALKAAMAASWATGAGGQFDGAAGGAEPGADSGATGTADPAEVGAGTGAGETGAGASGLSQDVKSTTPAIATDASLHGEKLIFI